MDAAPSSRAALFLALIGLSGLGATCKSEAPPPAPTELEVPAETPAPAAEPATLEGVELRRVPPAYRADAVRLLRESFCYCGCTRTVAACLSDRSACSCVQCSERVAEFVLSAYETGARTAEIENLTVELFSEAYNASPVDFDVEGRPTVGSPDARYTLVEFADFQCPHCRTAFGQLVAFAKRRPDVKLVYRYYPLPSFGEPSVLAARAAEAAHRQGKFWPMAALLYENQRNLDPATIDGLARQAGLDMARFEQDLKDPAVASVIKADKQAGAAAGVRGTPALYLNGRPFGLGHDPDSLALRLAMEADRNDCD